VADPAYGSESDVANSAYASLLELIDHVGRARAKGLITIDEAAGFIRLTRRAKGAATAYVRYLESAPEPCPPSERRGDRRPEARRKADGERTRNPKPGTRNPEPGTGDLP
jgi:hypothetical protein